MRALPLALALTALVAGCRPIRTEHGFDYAYPRTRSDFTVRWIGLGDGRAAMWITTANDGEANNRYEGIEFFVDPGSPRDVETHVLPQLQAKGLKKGSKAAWILLTGSEPEALAGAERLSKELQIGGVI